MSEGTTGTGAGRIESDPACAAPADAPGEIGTRLVTGKVYRSFPELDRFTDEQCEQFVRHALGAGAIAWWLLGLVIRDRWLRRTIRSSLRHTRCPRCEYSLLGLAVAEGAVVCPQYGMRVGLAERGLTAEMLMAEV